MERRETYNFNRPHTWYQEIENPCRLFNPQSNLTMELKKVVYDVKINCCFANTNLTQFYSNTTQRAQNITYMFPILPEAVITGLRAVFNGKTLIGKIEPKKEANKKFEEYKEKGYTAALAQHYTPSSDVLKLEIGNLPPNEEIQILISFTQKLDIINSVYWGLRIPSTLTPRYRMTNKTLGLFPSSGIQTTGIPIYNWEIDVEINWNSGISKVECLTHNVEISKKSENSVSVKLGEGEIPNKDFELMIKDSHIFGNFCSVSKLGEENMPEDLERFKDLPKYAAVMQFVPSFYSWYVDNGVSNLEGVDVYKEENNDFLLDSTFSEYIFVIDRSGSMSGRRMDMAKQALVFFLKSLPENSYFNIVSFGSKFDTMFWGSKGTHKVQQAINLIWKFSANYGGTEILKPLKKIFESKQNDQKYQRNIFLLTDGAVSDVNSVLEKIEKKCYMNRNRVFCIGIGNGCSTYLIKEGARKGNGRSVILSDSDSIQGKVIDLLYKSMSPSMTNFQVEFDKRYISAIAPMPKDSHHLLKDEPFKMFALISNELEKTEELCTTVKVRFYNSCTKEEEVRAFKIRLEGAMIDDAYHKICVDQILKNYDTLDFNYISSALEAREKFCEDVSMFYQVISPKYTSFLMLIDKNESRIDDEQKAEDVLIPNIQSVDYNQLEAGRYNSLVAGTLNGGIPSYQKGGVQLQSLKFYTRSKKSKSSCCGGGGGSYSSYSAPVSYSRGQEAQTISRSSKGSLTNKEILIVIERQNPDGSWDYSDDLLENLKEKDGAYNTVFEKLKNILGDLNLLMTLVIYGWLVTRKDDGSLIMILAKAKKNLRKKSNPEALKKFPKLLKLAESMWKKAK